MKSLLSFCCWIFSFIAFTQPPLIKWSSASIAKGGTTYELLLTGQISPGWHVYAKPNAVGLEPVSIKWDHDSVVPNKRLQFSGNITAIDDKIFQEKLQVFTGTLSLNQSVTIKGDPPAFLKINITGFASNRDSFLPFDDTISLSLNRNVVALNQNLTKLSNLDLNNPLADCGEKQNTDRGILTIFFIGFLGGLIALLTPCVFPMIPITVSFFIHKSVSRGQAIRNAVSYGVFILLIYIMASLPFHLLGDIDPQVFNSISTNTWVNLFFFVVFLLFALSFFGLFNIQLPSSLANSADSKGSINSIGGIFFMALTIAIVSFSCTGPILGSLIVTSLSSDGNAWQLTAGISGFGMAIGLPFALLAMFPGWIQKLPQSGGWLNTVKISLAFLELALALKFLSNADLVNHWGILKREIFIGIWFLIALGLAVYLSNIYWYLRYGKFSISPVRIAFASLAMVFALYLVPGFTNSKYAKLSILSGFTPPVEYSIYKHRQKITGLSPHVINDYEKAVALAKKANKPLLVDFTGWACVNCRKMEEQVWSEEEISNMISDNFILVSLYVDDRKKLPPADRFTYTDNDGNEKDINTIGEKFSVFQAENFKQVTQPLYVILSPDERLLNNPVGYTANVNEYKDWLECGAATFNSLSNR